jgi:hypothetical protein
LNQKRTIIVLAAAAGILAGLAACHGQRAAPTAKGAASGGAIPDRDRGDGGKDMHGCGGHEGGSCGAEDDDKH